MSVYFDQRETQDPEQRETALMAALPALIQRAKTAPGWASILRDIDAAAITDRVSLACLPLTRKSDLKQLQSQNLPFGGLTTTAPGALARLYMSPGPIFDPEGRGQDWWRFARPLYALGVRAGDILHNCFSYHFTPAAFMVEGAAAALGCAVIPAGTGQTELQVQALQQLQASTYVGTPSFLKIILEKAAEMQLALPHLKRALVGAEALPPSLRQGFLERGLEQVLQVYASADIGNIAYESSLDKQVLPGLILDEDLILEIVNPHTGIPVETGEVGEVVISSFNPDYPLLRFATGDLSAILPGQSACGRSNQRIRGWLGRADQTSKVKGMFVHPAQVSEVSKRHPQIAKARLVLTGTTGSDVMTLHCELQPDCLASTELKQAIVNSLREVSKLRGEVIFVEINSLPADGKSIDDLRSYD